MSVKQLPNFKEEINMSKNYILIALAIFLFWSCREDPSADGIPGEDYIAINVSVAPSDVMLTRATTSSPTPDESVINSLSVFVFDINGDRLLQRDDYDSSNLSDQSFKLYLRNEARNAVNPQIYVVANAINLNNNLDNISGKGDLEGITQNDCIDGNNGLLMSGKVENSNGIYSLSLKRSAAKITVEYTGEEENFKVKGFTVYNVADECYVMGATASPQDDNNVTAIVRDGKLTAYVNPTIAFDKSTQEVKSFVVIEAEYGGETCYYRIDICRSNGQGKYDYFDLEPNKWYQLKIKSVAGKGYESADIAAQHAYTDNNDIETEEPEPEIPEYPDFEDFNIFATTDLFIHDSDKKLYQNYFSDDYFEYNIVVKEYWKWITTKSPFIYKYKERIDNSTLIFSNDKFIGFHFPVMQGDKPWWYHYTFYLYDTIKTWGYYVTFTIEKLDDTDVWDSLELKTNDDYYYGKNLLGKEVESNLNFWLISGIQNPGYEEYTGIDNDYTKSVALLVITGSSGKQVKVPLFHTGNFEFNTNDNCFYFVEQ